MGILASPYGKHCGTDRNISAVFAGVSPSTAHGVLAITFKPVTYTVVAQTEDFIAEEAAIYTRKLRFDGKTQLLLKSKLLQEPLEATPVGFEGEKARVFCEELEALLKERSIPFIN